MLQKTFTLPNQSSGNSIRVRYTHIDLNAREASAHFYLYVSASAPKDCPLCLIATLRLTGAKFDEYFSAEALAALSNPGTDPVRTQFYLAALANEPVSVGGGITQTEFADLGGFTDAQSVI